MFVATTFASNVARVKTLAEAGKRAGRTVCLMGRAMRQMIEAAVETGVLTDFPATVTPEEAGNIPRENLMLIVTGSQGERRAASAQLANGKYNGITMKEGDTFLFSSKKSWNLRADLAVARLFARPAHKAMPKRPTGPPSPPGRSNASQPGEGELRARHHGAPQTHSLASTGCSYPSACEHACVSCRSASRVARPPTSRTTTPSCCRFCTSCPPRAAHCSLAALLSP